MNIQELDAYNLDDAVKFNDHLNPRIWGKDEHLLPEVRERLLLIAEDFKETLGVKDLDLRDITISGSNAAYTYTPNSDIDLHLVVDMPENPVYRELFDAKKFQYNETHNIKIGGSDVELYVQAADQPHYSQGIYSVSRNEWIQVPRRVRSTVDDTATRNKFETIGHQIEAAIKSGDREQLERMAAKIKKMRQTGLEQHGEFGPENLAFKMLRSQGVLQQLHDARAQARSQELSLRERRKPGSVFTYGFRHEDEQAVAPVVTTEAEEKALPTDEEILRDFVAFCAKELKLNELPVIKLRRDPQWSVVHKTFGRYVNDRKMLEVAWGQRHIMDVLRTVAHELTHRHQHERDGAKMGPDAGETGSPYENEANARAGVLMRDYARLHPEFFEAGQTEELHIDEGVRSSAAAAAVVAALAGGPVTAQAQNILGTIRDVGTAVRQAQNITRAGLNDEVQQEIRNFIRAQGGDPGSQNLSRLYQVQQELQRQEFQSGTLPGYVQQAAPATNESASGYIPTRKQARDPRYSMALTQDIRPGQLGKEANKLNLKTDRQGHPQVAQANGLFEELALQLSEFKRTGKLNAPELTVKQLAKKHMVTVDQINSQLKKGIQVEKEHTSDPATAKEIALNHLAELPDYYDRLEQIENPQQLDEVRMSPSNLMQWARSPEAEGIRAGFEAELIFRDTNSGDDDNEDMEPDYDMDERCRSISQVVEFFQDDEYGYGLSERNARQLQESLDEKYMEWMDEKMYDSWRDERDELIKEAWLRDKPMSERIHAALVDGLDLTDEQADAVERLAADREAGKIKGSDMSEEQLDMISQYSEARSIADDILEEDVEQTIEKEDGFYDEVLDDFRSDFYVDDDSSFFSDIGLRWMSDVSNEYDLGWPYLTGGAGNGGSRDWESIGDSLHDTIDMPVKVSSGYHSATRKEGLWIVEPDSSLQPDDREDYGLEIVSPPMPLLTALEKLQEVTDWANDTTEGDAYTNSSTGLHMGVSVPFKGGDVDYLKLVLFLGDEYVLKQFGREANTYTKSAMSKFKENIKGGRTDPMSVIKLMQHGLLELAQREVQKGVGEGKYTSVHVQKGYIEFRSAGGDWLAEESADPEKLSSTMLRYARAMSIAANPGEERREYAKKLYKLIAPEGDSQLALFSQFASGELTAEQLKKKWAEKTIGTEKKMNQRWKLFYADGTPVPGAEWNGYTEDQVKNAVWSKYGREALDSGKYELRNMSEEQQWEVYAVDSGETLEIVKGRNKGEVADKVYDKYVDQGIGFNVRPYEDPATMTPRAKLAKRITTKKPEPKQVANQATNERGVPYWEVYEIETDHVVHTFLSDTATDAKVDGSNWLKGIGAEYPDLFAVRPKIKTAQVKDVEPDVAQNFNQPQDATDIPRNWEFVNRINGQVIHNMTNASYNQANVVQTNLELRYPDADIYLRSVANLEENFADGKGPGRPGDSQRHGIPKGATIAQLEKAAKAPGRKGQLARWQLNMRRGKARAK
jgi:hypothetical protein